MELTLRTLSAPVTLALTLGQVGPRYWAGGNGRAYLLELDTPHDAAYNYHATGGLQRRGRVQRGDAHAGALRGKASDVKEPFLHGDIVLLMLLLVLLVLLNNVPR